MDAGTAATITNLTSPTNSGDAATKGYVDTADALKLNLSGGTMSGAIAMGTNKITGLGNAGQLSGRTYCSASLYRHLRPIQRHSHQTVFGHCDM